MRELRREKLVVLQHGDTCCRGDMVLFLVHVEAALLLDEVDLVHYLRLE